VNPVTGSPKSTSNSTGEVDEGDAAAVLTVGTGATESNSAVAVLLAVLPLPAVSAAPSAPYDTDTVASADDGVTVTVYVSPLPDTSVTEPSVTVMSAASTPVTAESNVSENSIGDSDVGDSPTTLMLAAGRAESNTTASGSPPDAVLGLPAASVAAPDRTDTETVAAEDRSPPTRTANVHVVPDPATDSTVAVAPSAAAANTPAAARPDTASENTTSNGTGFVAADRKSNRLNSSHANLS